MAYVYAERIVREQSVDYEIASDIVRNRFVTLILVSIVYFIAVVIGLILLVIPGIYIGARLSPALPASVLDEYGVSDSLSVGWDIGQGNVLKLLGIFLLTVVVPGILFSGAAVAAGFDVAQNPVFSLALSPVGAVFSAIGELALARVYIENY
jgi:membrane-anchored glycerophosphoryl diester phosphodiesterase (GDPDase)